MNKIEAEQVVANLDEDQRLDLLMYLAEEFDFHVTKSMIFDDTYFLSTGDHDAT